MDMLLVMKLTLAVAIGVALVSNVVLYLAFKMNKVEISFPRAIRPGYLENLYRQTPAMHTPILGMIVQLAALSKILAVVTAVLFVVVKSAAH